MLFPTSQLESPLFFSQIAQFVKVDSRKRISQETFDSVVKENVDDFDMSPEEAVADAIQQFKSQGVDLSCIVKSAGPASESPVIKVERANAP